MKRNKGTQLGVVLAAMLLLSFIFVPEAMAKTQREESNFSDPIVVQALMDKFVKEGVNSEKFFENLSPEEQAAVIKAMKVDKIIVTRTEGEVSITGTEICNSPRIEETAYNWLGMSLWKYIQTINRCYDGSTLTRASRTRSGAAFVFYWQFAGHIDSAESGGAGQSSYEAYTQGRFTNCIVDICSTERYPYIDMIVYGDGGFWSNHGGGGTI